LVACPFKEVAQAAFIDAEGVLLAVFAAGQGGDMGKDALYRGDLVKVG
jgi:hypothetical protein